MATSGTTAFDLNVDELIEESFERCGLELRTGYDLQTARRSLNLMFAEWANRGLNLWVIEERTESLTEGTASYDLDADLVNVLSAVIRTTSGSTTTDYTDHIKVPCENYKTLSIECPEKMSPLSSPAYAGA